jgi:hypothetical protein
MLVNSNRYPGIAPTIFRLLSPESPAPRFRRPCPWCPCRQFGDTRLTGYL